MRADGGEVELRADDDQPGGWLLLLDRVRQSYVSLDDPTYLEFPYVQVLAEAIDALRTGPVDAVHVGGGGATLARWLATIRPGSNQVVFETHPELLRVVQSRLPMPVGSDVDFRLADGRSGVAALEADSADVVVLDAFSGGRVPAELSTAEFFADVCRVLRPDGILLMNTTGAQKSDYLRRLVAALAASFGQILIHGEQGDIVGNLVIMASRSGALPAFLLAADEGPLGRPVALAGSGLREFVGPAVPLTDSSSLRSPIPPDETWRLGTD